MMLPLALVLLSLMFMPGVSQTQAPAGQQTASPIAEELWAATRAGDAARVTAALDKGADVNAKTRYGATALTFAADRGHVEIVKLLIARGADVNVAGHVLPDARRRHGDDEQPSRRRDAAARARIERRAGRAAAGHSARQRAARRGGARSLRN